MEITVTKGLSELKMLDKRIRRKIEDAVLGGYSEGGKIMTGYDTKEDLERTVKSNFTSIKDLIKRRNELNPKLFYQMQQLK